MSSFIGAIRKLRKLSASIASGFAAMSAWAAFPACLEHGAQRRQIHFALGHGCFRCPSSPRRSETRPRCLRPAPLLPIHVQALTTAARTTLPSGGRNTILHRDRSSLLHAQAHLAFRLVHFEGLRLDRGRIRSSVLRMMNVLIGADLAHVEMMPSTPLPQTHQGAKFGEAGNRSFRSHQPRETSALPPPTDRPKLFRPRECPRSPIFTPRTTASTVLPR